MRYLKFITILIMSIICSCSGDDNNEFKPVIAEEVEFFQDGEVEMLFDNAGPDGITMIFVGDGYVKEDLGKIYGSYKADAERYFDYLFSVEPFAGYREHFNAAIIYAESQSREIPQEENTGSTAVGTYTYIGWTGRNFYTANQDRIEYYKNKLPSGYKTNSNTLIVLNERGGGNACYACDVAFSGSSSETTMVHEIGHSFGALGDEYELQNLNNPPNATFSPNLDVTDNLSLIKWKHFIDVPGYGNVGAYEGGGYVSTGVWRPLAESIMRGGSSILAEQFNPPSREAIVKRIYEIRGLEYDFETFLSRDVITRTPLATTTKSTRPPIDCIH